MSKLFYPKLALTNIRKNRQTYFPYILACIGSIMMFYIMHSISTSPGLLQMSGGETILLILNLGNIVIGFFSAIFLFYTNSFLIKRRKKEIGLYNILGMEKKHIARMLFYETLFTALIALALGLAGGMLLSKLMFWLLLRLLNFSVPIAFGVSLQSVGTTATLFALIFLATLFFTLRQIHVANPVELLRGGQVGEKEPKTKGLLAVIGVLCLGAGYYLALWVESPVDAIFVFFVAVLLVMAGTYALFTAGSIAILKLLRRNKRFYYQTKHFTAVSGMIYRMKQNALGLANICILSTAVLVVLSTTVCLYVGREEVVNRMYPRDVAVYGKESSEAQFQQTLQLTREQAQQHGLTLENELAYRYEPYAAIRDGSVFFLDANSYDYTSVCQLILMTQEEYNRIQGDSVTLARDEALIYGLDGRYGGDAITLGGQRFVIRQELDTMNTAEQSGQLIKAYYVVLADEAVIRDIARGAGLEPPAGMKFYIGHDLRGDLEAQDAYTGGLSEQVVENRAGYVDSRRESQAAFYSLYGGFFFLGIFLGILFLMATALIIYYKQVSEGYDDKARFEIMQKVGMSRQEIKATIRSQIVMVFFLPLAAAVVHIAFAFSVITQLLSIFGLTNFRLFLGCTAATIALFAVIYFIVYSWTQRVYYRIVE